MADKKSCQDDTGDFPSDFKSKLKFMESKLATRNDPSDNLATNNNNNNNNPYQELYQSHFHRNQTPNQRDHSSGMKRAKEKRTAVMTSPHFRILTSSCYDSPIPENCIRLVCLSDTHSMVEETNFVKNVPYGDVLLHAGDFTDHGEICQYQLYNSFLEQLPHPIKLATPGNHELTLDPRGLSYDLHIMRRDLRLPDCRESPNEENYKDVLEKLLGLLSNSIILVDAWVSVCGIKIYGYPWLPMHGVPGFGLKRQGDLRKKQQLIPGDTDILLSHGPPRGFGDLTRSGKNVGCVHLANTVSQRVRPKLVLSGHIHEGRGLYTDGITTYINASICNRVYNPVHDTVVIDYTLPAGYTRHEHVLKLDQKSLIVNRCEPETCS